MIIIPSPVFGVPFTPDNIRQCQNIGLIQASVSVYAGKAGYMATAPGFPVPVNGQAKYWCDPNRTVAIGHAAFDGSSHPAGNLSNFEQNFYDPSTIDFYREHPTLPIPTIGPVMVTPVEWQRVSFPADDDLIDYSDPKQRPAETPLGLIWSMTITPSAQLAQVNRMFCSGVLFMEKGQAAWASIEEANVLFHVINVPTGPGTSGGSVGWSDAQVLHLANQVDTSAAARQAVRDIVRGSMPDVNKAARLMQI